jgi:hypothetical protein
MDWTYPRGAGPEGIYEIGRRLARHIGRMPDATTFTNDAREMLRITRRVEAVAEGGRLLVGFQNAGKLELERERYERLVAAGTDIVAFGSGALSEGIPGLEYRELSPDTNRLANNWFLVTDDPERVGFVSWEIGDPATFGVGGAATPGKQFVGFITDDPLVVAELASVLAVQARPRPVPGGPGSAAGTDRPDPRDQALVDAVSQTSSSPSGAGPGAVVVAMGRDQSDRAFRVAAAIARDEGRSLVIVDRSSESIFGTPYNDLRGDDDYRPQPDRLFGAAIARREGRGSTARALDAASALGVEAGAWFPTRSGSDGLAEAVERFAGGLIVLPESVRRPSVAERIRGMNLDTLERIGVPIIVAD